MRNNIIKNNAKLIEFMVDIIFSRKRKVAKGSAKINEWKQINESKRNCIKNNNKTYHIMRNGVKINHNEVKYHLWGRES